MNQKFVWPFKGSNNSNIVTNITCYNKVSQKGCVHCGSWNFFVKHEKVLQHHYKDVEAYSLLVYYIMTNLDLGDYGPICLNIKKMI